MNKIKKLLAKYNDIPVAAKATLWFMFAGIVQKTISVLTTPIFTRLMSTDQYGQYTVYNSWLQIFTIICTLRLNWSVFNKGMSKFKDGRDDYAATMQTVTLGISCILLIVYLVFRTQINRLTELPTFIMLAMIVELMFTPAIDFWTVRKRYEYQYKPVVIRTLVMAGINAALGVAAVLIFDEKGYARILSCILVNVVFGVTLFTYNLRRAKKPFVREYAKFAILFNLPLLLHYFSQYILDQFDKFMIQKMVGFSAAALYGVAYSAGLLMKIVTNSINQALIPWQYSQLEKKEVRHLDDTLFVILIFVGAVSVVFSAVAPELMSVFAGSKYREAMYVIPPVAVGMFFLFAYTAFANSEFFFDLNKFTMFISMGGALLNVILNYFGIKLFGYIAAAYTTLICYIVFSVSHYIYMSVGVNRKMGIDLLPNLKRFILLGAVITACGVSVTLIYDKVVIRYGIVAVLLAAALIKRQYLISILRSLRNKA